MEAVLYCFNKAIGSRSMHGVIGAENIISKVAICNIGSKDTLEVEHLRSYG